MKKVISKINVPLLLFMLIYSIFGLIMIFSASSVTAVLRYGYASNHFFVRQLIWIIVAYLAGFVVLFIPTRWYRIAVNKITLVLVLVAMAVLLAIGAIAGGAKSWFDMGNYSLQPVEFLKIFWICYLAVYYHRISVKKKCTFMGMFFPIIVLIVILALVAMQPDLGGCVIVMFITGMIFFALPFGKDYQKRAFGLGVVGAIGGILLFLAIGDKIFESYQYRRLTEFSNACQRYSDESGYQVCNGYIAIHNGGLFGVGLGESTQKYSYLPEAHTDFIFPIICEELGVIVGILLVLGYMVMLIFVLNVAKSTYTLRDSILCYGIFAYILAHILVNLLGVLGLIPLTGVPLPFLSYGGSYNLSLIVGLFIVQRVSVENKLEKKKKLIENL